MVWTAERMYSQARALIPNEEGTLEMGKLFPLSPDLLRISHAPKTVNVRIGSEIIHCLVHFSI
jgi:hypothetical protein